MSDIIKLLPDSVANQIAAGEVIQRPASVIKELVENSADAGARSIDIVLKDAGRTLIQVIDDGKGMSDTDARMAFERHATSKISSAADLFTLHTMGFRGEALASIAAVAQVDVRTRQKDASLGTRLLINGSRVESQTPEACPEGTNLMVKNLFFNIPVRRKFLKKDSVELAQILREFERLALANPSLSLSIMHNDVMLQQLRPSTLLQRIIALFGKSLEKNLLEVDTETSLVRIDGFICTPEGARRRNPLQYMFVNGRHMRHPYFHKAVISCYEELLPPDTQPNYFLNFVVDPETIDVNIHPTKTEIKFENEQPIWQILNAAVREALGRAGVGPALEFNKEDAPDIPAFTPITLPEPTAQRDAEADRMRNAHRDRMLDWDKLYAEFERKANTDPQQGPTGLSSGLNTPLEPRGPKPMQGALDLEVTETAAAMQLRNRYIITPAHEGLLLIDQHRAHKRILYERYLQRISSPKAEPPQSIMFPEILQLNAAGATVLEHLMPEVTRLGFELTPLGDFAWSITGTPSWASESVARDLLQAIIEQGADGADAPTDEIMRERLALCMAEAGAVRAGQPLAPAEIDRITSDLFKLKSPAYTPDGRRTFLVLTMDEIAKMFS